MIFFSLVHWQDISSVQQVPEEIERVMAGLEAYLSIRRHTSDTGLSFFEEDDESGKGLVEKVCILSKIYFWDVICL